ncbi:hypothetical protein Hanom_Chr03g00183421 [Helianthus anomalus]
MYKPKNLQYNTLMHKNNIKTPNVHKARASDPKKTKICAFLALCGKGALINFLKSLCCLLFHRE